MEDTLLKQNVSGQWSKHSQCREKPRPDDDDDYDIESEEGEDQEEDNSAPQDSSTKWADMSMLTEEEKFEILSERDFGHQTGIKGVLADYKASKRIERATKQREKELRENALLRIAKGAVRKEDDGNDLDTLLADEEEDEDEFMKNYRAQRLTEMMKSSARKSFGQLLKVNNDSFVEEIDSVASEDVVIVVHLFDSTSSACVKLNSILDVLAKKEFIHIKFICMEVDEASVVIDRIALPLLQFYKHGELVHTIAAVHVEVQNVRYNGKMSTDNIDTRMLSRDFSKDDIEWLLNSTELCS